jgi:hypothetical protein
MGLRTGLDTESRGKLICLCRGSNPVLPVCSQTLYWLSYPSSYAVPLHAMQATRGYDTYIRSSYSFLTSTLDKGDWSASRPSRALPPENGPSVRLDRRLVGPSAGLDKEARRKIIWIYQGSNTGRPVCSQTLYWLNYTAYYAVEWLNIKILHLLLKIFQN